MKGKVWVRSKSGLQIPWDTDWILVCPLDRRQHSLWRRRRIVWREESVFVVQSWTSVRLTTNITWRQFKMAARPSNSMELEVWRDGGKLQPPGHHNQLAGGLAGKGRKWDFLEISPKIFSYFLIKIFEVRKYLSSAAQPSSLQCWWWPGRPGGKWSILRRLRGLPGLNQHHPPPPPWHDTNLPPPLPRTDHSSVVVSWPGVIALLEHPTAIPQPHPGLTWPFWLDWSPPWWGGRWEAWLPHSPHCHRLTSNYLSIAFRQLLGLNYLIIIFTNYTRQTRQQTPQIELLATFREHLLFSFISVVEPNKIKNLIGTFIFDTVSISILTPNFIWLVNIVNIVLSLSRWLNLLIF